MDWEKARNYTIIFLIILNILFIGLNFAKDRQYILKQSQKQAVTDVLKQNGIQINSQIPDKFFPLQHIYMKQYNYDVLKIQDIFFEDKKNIKRTEEFDKTIFNSEYETIIIQDGIVMYENNKVQIDFELTEEDAFKICERFINKIESVFDKMTFDRITKDDDHFIIEYGVKYGDYFIFNNYFKVYIFENGTIKVQFEYRNPTGYVGPKTEICSADEALFIFMSEFKKIYETDNIVIDKIDLGYYVNELSKDSNAIFTVVPNYRIFVENHEMPYYVNAYNNVFVGT